MIRTALLLVLGTSSLLGEDAVAPRVVLPDLKAVGFDDRCIVPDSVVADARSVVSRVEAILTRVWRDAEGESRTVGDLVREIRRAPIAQRSAVRKRVLDAAGVALETRAALDAWLDDSGLFDPAWKPDEPAENDGMWEPDPLRANSSLGIPGAGDEIVFRQGAALIFSDLATIKRVERDFARYPKRAGATYESIEMAAGSWVRGEVESFGSLVAYRCDFVSDLPFPFGNYRCELAVIDRLDDRGRLRCDIHAAGGDFHFMVGCDVYFPVRAADGELVAWCVARVFAFDLSGVPDGDDDRAQALRASVLNLKRDAERAWGGKALPKSDSPDAALVAR